MQALVCREPGTLALERRDGPAAPPAGWALVDVAFVGICGTDYHIYEGKHPFLQYPRVMGHEISGTVREAGDGVALAVGTPVIVNPYLACGDCIACRRGKPNACTRIEVLGVHRDGGMCERILVPGRNLYRAEGLSLRDAATVEFLAIGAHAVRRSRLGAGDRALVIGAGPIGLGTAIFAGHAGATVTMLDTSAERLGFAADTFGFGKIDGARADVAATVREVTAGDGFDVVFDATGNTASMRSAFAHVAHGGALVLVSVVKDEITFSDPEFHKREMSLIGSRNALQDDFEAVAQAIGAGKVPLNKLVTHVTTLRDAARDLPRWTHERSGLIKAIVQVAEPDHGKDEVP